MVNLGASCCTFWAVEPGVSFSKVTYVTITVSPAKINEVLCIYQPTVYNFLLVHCIMVFLDFSVGFTSTLNGFARK